MIEHKINDESIDSEDVGFTLVIRSPFLNTEQDGSGTYTFTIPASDRVRKIMKWIHRVQSLREEQPMNWKTYHTCRKVLDGTAICTQADETKYEMAVGAGKGDFFYKIKDKKLTDLNYEDVVMGTTIQEVINYMLRCVSNIYPYTDVCFPMVNIPEFYGSNNENNPSFKGIINFYHTTLGYQANTPYIYQGVVVHSNDYSISPYAFLIGVINKIFSDFGYTVEGSFLNHSEIRKLIFFNNYALDYKEKHHYATIGHSFYSWTFQNNNSYYALHVANIYENIDSNLDPTDHYYVIQSSGMLSVVGYFAFQMYYTSADITIDIMIDNDILETFTFTGSDSAKFEITSNHVLESNSYGKKIWFNVKANCPPSLNSGIAQLLSSRISIYNQTESELNRYLKSYNLKNHLPGILINDFLKALTLGFGIFFFYDHKLKHCRIRTANEILSDPEVVDFNSNIITPLLTKPQSKKKFKINFEFGNNEDLLTENFLSLDEYHYKGEVTKPSDCIGSDADYFVVKNVGCIYLNYIENYVAGFRKYSDNYYDVFIGDADEVTEVKIGFSPLFMTFAESYPGEGIASCLIPYSKIKGTSPAYPTGKNEFDLRFLIYHGMQNNMHLNQYPFASSNNYDFAGNRIGELALNLTSEDGLLELFLKPYYEFLLDLVRYETEKYISIKELEDFDTSKKHNIFQNFFIDYAEIDLDKSDMLHAKLYLARKSS